MDVRETVRARSRETGSSSNSYKQRSERRASTDHWGPRALLLTLWLYSRLLLDSSLLLVFVPFFLPLHLLYRGPSLFCTSESRGFLRVDWVIDFLPVCFVEPRKRRKETLKFNFVRIWSSKVGTRFCPLEIDAVLIYYLILEYLVHQNVSIIIWQLNRYLERWGIIEKWYFYLYFM